MSSSTSQPVAQQFLKKRVAIIGGGIAGLACAAQLQKLGMKDIVVFDTGKRGPGGRASSRSWKGQVVDHACQVIPAKTKEFNKFMMGLVEKGAARPLDLSAGRFGTIAFPSGEFTPQLATASSDAATSFYVGGPEGGIGQIATAIAKDVNSAIAASSTSNHVMGAPPIIKEDVWISPNAGVKKGPTDDQWTLTGAGRNNKFDALVIAHNGKCAERLTSQQPAERVHTLLRARFNDQLPSTTGGGRNGKAQMTLNSVYSLMFEVPSGVIPDNFDFATTKVISSGDSRRETSSSAATRVQEQHQCIIATLSNNTRKYDGGAGGSTTTLKKKKSAPRQDEIPHIWTAISTGAYGKANKVAQEHLAGTDDEKRITCEMLSAVERLVGLPAGTLTGKRADNKKNSGSGTSATTGVSATKLQLWGAGLPLNYWNSSCIWDGQHQIGVAGDWLSEDSTVASTMEAAWLSGTALAHQIANPNSHSSSYGLDLGQNGKGRFLPTLSSSPYVKNSPLPADDSVGAAFWVAEPRDYVPRASSPASQRFSGGGRGLGRGRGGRGSGANESSRVQAGRSGSPPSAPFVAAKKQQTSATSRPSTGSNTKTAPSRGRGGWGRGAGGMVSLVN